MPYEMPNLLSPTGIIEMLLRFGSLGEQQKGFDEAKDANLRNFGESLLELRQNEEDVGGIIDSGQAEERGLMGGALGNFTSGNEQALGKLTGLLQGGKWDAWQEAARSLDQYGAGSDAIMGGYSDLAGSLPGQYGSRAEDIFGRAESGYGDIVGGFSGRESDLLGMLEGAGDQARKDIDQDFAESESSRMQDLARRGLTGSTVSSSIAAGTERDKQDAIGRLNEALRGERVGLAERTSADTLGAKGSALANMLNLRTGLTGDTLGATERTAMNKLLAETGFLGGETDLRQSGMDRFFNWAGTEASAVPGAMFSNAASEYGGMGDLMNMLRSQRGEKVGSMFDTTNAIVNLRGMREDMYPQQGPMGAGADFFSRWNQPRYEEPKTDWWSPLVGGATSLGGSMFMGAGAAGGFGNLFK
jgi:hypothetical protein